jgi:iron(III) transport system permease protein
VISRRLAWILFLSAGATLLLLFVWPLTRVLSGGFFVDGRFTLQYLADVFRNPIYAEGLWNSLKLGIGTTALASAIAIPLAWIANRYEFPGKGLLCGLILVPMILPPFVGAIGFQQILGQYGALNALFGLGPVDWLGQGRYVGVVVLQSLGLYPILYLNAAAALANIDPAMEEAAENLGCSGFRKFRRITLPLMMPGLFAGGAILFIWSFTELGTPLIMGYTRCASVQVYDALKEIGSNPFPYALVFVMLSCSVALYAAVRLTFGRRAHAMQSKAAVTFSARRLRGGRAALAALPFVLVIGVALLPHLGVVLTSFSEPGSWYRGVLPEAWTLGNYRDALGHAMTVSSIRNSLIFSLLAVALNLVLGIAVALVVVRSSLRFRGVLDALAMIPLAVPGLVMAFGFLSISSLLSNLEWVRQSAFWSGLFDVRTNPTLFLVVAYAVRRLPYMARAAVAGLQQTSVTLEESAANLGAGPATTLRRVTVPLIMANLIAGVLLAFSFSMLEVSDSLMLAQRAEYYPITKTIYELYQLIGSGRFVASALGVWAMLFLAVTILGSSLLLGRKLGAVFRI